MKNAILMLLPAAVFSLTPLTLHRSYSSHTRFSINKRKRLHHFSAFPDAPEMIGLFATVKDDRTSVEQEDEETMARVQQINIPQSANPVETVEKEDGGLKVQVTKWLKNSIFLGIDPTPEIWAIVTIYFVEGALGLALLARTYLLKDELHLGPAELSALTGLFSIPWTIKPLYGFLSDGVPLFGYRRRSYLVLAGLIGCLSYIALGANFWNVLDGTNGDTSLLVQGSMFAFIISSACIAFSDVVADGIVVQRTRDSSDPLVAGGLQSLCWGSAAVGGLLSAYFSGSLLEIMSPRQVLGLTAVLPFLVAAISFLIDEKPISTSPGTTDNQSPSVKNQIDALWSAIKQPAIWKPVLFLFLWQSTPTSDGAFFYFLTNDLGMGPEFLGRARLVTSVAGLLGVWVYQKYLRKVRNVC
jgi:folate/biopterin transporter